MPASLFVVHGSHPCATVQRALELKGIEHRIGELPPAGHAPVVKVLFGRRTVPALRLEDGERLTGSREILRRLDELVPSPALLPDEPAARERVLAAEAWGDDVLQPVARRVLWHALDHSPTAIPTFQEHSALPLPAAIRPLLTPAIVALEWRMNGITDAGVRADLQDLPRQLDRIDAWLQDGTLGGPQTNAADLQIAATLRLLMTMEDLDVPFRARPAGTLALRVFPEWDGRVPAGAFPEEWLSALKGGVPAVRA
jgi:glutathione S-transferase